METLSDTIKLGY